MSKHIKINSIFDQSIKICQIEKYVQNEGHIFVEENKIISSVFPKGVFAKIEKKNESLELKMVIQKKAKIKSPLFFCFGISGRRGKQNIVPKIIVDDESEVKIISHCAFPQAQKVEHKMEGIFKIGKNAKLFYEEHHYHGLNSGAVVSPDLKIDIEEGGYCQNNFNLIRGTVGKTKINLEVLVKKNAQFVSEIKTLGQSNKDKVEIWEKIYLIGEASRSIIKMRAAAKNGGKVFMRGETYAQALDSYGHIDCQEIVIGKNSMAQAIPIVQVNHPGARVTHEAAVGKINQRELETLMTRGLNEDQATEMIINAILNK